MLKNKEFVEIPENGYAAAFLWTELSSIHQPESSTESSL